MKYFIKLLILLALPYFSPAQNAWPILDKVTQKLNRVKDYSVEATIISNIPLIRILPVKATIYYQQPDQFKIKAKGIAIIPRQGFADIPKLLKNKENYNAILTGNDIINQSKTTIITLLPNNDTSDIVLMKLWVDEVNNVVLRLQSTTRSNGSVTTNYMYGSQVEYGLPDEIDFTVDVKKFKMPKGIATDINKSSELETKPASTMGKIKVTLKDYTVNKGLKLEVFKSNK